MGCDIHLHTEVKIGGRWLHYGAPTCRRNYMLFGLMAGVREESVDPVSAPKGLPADMSEITALSAKRWAGGGHTHSWLGPEEIAILDERFHAECKKRWPGEWIDLEEHKVGYLEGNSWAGFAKYPDDRPLGIEDVRWVFWFDN